MRLRYGPESSADSEPVPALLDHEHVIGVDDGSTDDSREIITSAGARVVCHAVNPGQVRRSGQAKFRVGRRAGDMAGGVIAELPGIPPNVSGMDGSTG
jgi:hypothetical protein